MGLRLTHGDQRQLRSPDLPKRKTIERWRRKVMGLKPQGHDCQTTEECLTCRLYGGRFSLTTADRHPLAFRGLAHRPDLNTGSA